MHVSCMSHLDCSVGQVGQHCVAHFNPGSNTHFGMRIYVASYQDRFIYKNSSLYSKDSQIIKVF